MSKNPCCDQTVTRRVVTTIFVDVEDVQQKNLNLQSSKIGGKNPFLNPYCSAMINLFVAQCLQASVDRVVEQLTQISKDFHADSAMHVLRCGSVLEFVFFSDTPEEAPMESPKCLSAGSLSLIQVLDCLLLSMPDTMRHSIHTECGFGTTIDTIRIHKPHEQMIEIEIQHENGNNDRNSNPNSMDVSETTTTHIARCSNPEIQMDLDDLLIRFARQNLDNNNSCPSSSRNHARRRRSSSVSVPVSALKGEKLRKCTIYDSRRAVAMC